MANEHTLVAVSALALPLIEAAGLDLWGAELLGEGRPILRIYVEGPDGVNIDACARLSRQIGLALDVEDVMPSAYILEVSSPGLTRPFFEPGQMQAYLGRLVEVTLNEPLPEFPRRKKFYGELLAVDGDVITLHLADAPESDAQTAALDWNNVRKAHLVHVFPQPGKGPKKKL